jgi:hypothetical protein
MNRKNRVFLSKLSSATLDIIAQTASAECAVAMRTGERKQAARLMRLQHACDMILMERHGKAFTGKY